MKTKVVYILIFILSVLTSCQKEEKETNVVIDLNTLTCDSINYSSFVDSISYIPLETTDESLIAKITDVLFTPQYIFIMDKRQQKVFAFDHSGKFSHTVGRNGQGLEEYASLQQFEYDKKGNELLLLDGWTKRILRFTPEGKFVDKVNLDLFPIDFKIVDNGYLLSQMSAPDSTAGVHLFDLQSGKSTQLFKCMVKIPTSFDWEMVSYGDTIAFMAPPFDNTDYHYADGQLSEYIPFQLEPFSGKEYDYQTASSMRNIEDFHRTNYIEGERWILTTFYSDRYSLRTFMYDKQTGKHIVGKITENDIDGRNGWICSSSQVEDNRFVFWVKPENEDDNPVLQILHLK